MPQHKKKLWNKAQPKKIKVGSDWYLYLCNNQECFNCRGSVPAYVPLIDNVPGSSLPKDCPANIPVCDTCVSKGNDLKFNFEKPNGNGK